MLVNTDINLGKKELASYLGDTVEVVPFLIGRKTFFFLLDELPGAYKQLDLDQVA